jgi:clan AA aspartic protease
VSLIEGYVNEALEPLIEIGLAQGEVVTMVSAVIDTGFSGSLCLAEQHIDHLDMTFVYAEPYELANGEVLVEDVFRGSIVFGGRKQEVDLILTASQDTLIGASLLKDYNLGIDYPGRLVRIERVVE